MKERRLQRFDDLSAPYRVETGEGFRLRAYDPGDTGPWTHHDKPHGEEALRSAVEAIADLQALLYAHDRWALLLIFQAMDAAGKDGAIKHVLSGVNPQGCQVASFSAPSAEELDHDFLWRCVRRLPERGRIGIFNRSYYEEVLVPRVHPEMLDRQRLPPERVSRQVWKERYESIRAFEQHLDRNGTVVCKFFLHLSRDEQKKRFLARIDQPAKRWKLSPEDVRDRRDWNDYQKAYEELIRHTATPEAPWHVVPADHKWFTRAVVASAVAAALGRLDIHPPRVTAQQRRQLAAARKALLND